MRTTYEYERKQKPEVRGPTAGSRPLTNYCPFKNVFVLFDSVDKEVRATNPVVRH
jgi:hypothetical protein